MNLIKAIASVIHAKRSPRVQALHQPFFDFVEPRTGGQSVGTIWVEFRCTMNIKFLCYVPG